MRPLFLKSARLAGDCPDDYAFRLPAVRALESGITFRVYLKSAQRRQFLQKKALAALLKLASHQGLPRFRALPGPFFAKFSAFFTSQIHPTAPVTFLCGENGTGKSTILEALAVAAGCNPEGGQGSQFFIATHSPILLAYPEAEIFVLDGRGLTPTRYEDTEPYQITKAFLDAPARMLRELWEE